MKLNRWRCCRMQHLRALTVLVTLISLSLLFSTFSTRTERSLGRQMLADGVAIDHADSTLGIRAGINSASNSVIVIKVCLQFLISLFLLLDFFKETKH